MEKTVESWSHRERREATDLMSAFLFGVAASTPVWAVIAGFLVMLRVLGS